MNTRKHDLDAIDAMRGEEQSEEGKKHLEALLVAVYEQSKDDHLERLRMKLEGAIRESMENPNDIHALQRFATIREEIIAYAKSDTFRKNMAAKIATVSQDEAENYFKRSA